MIDDGVLIPEKDLLRSPSILGALQAILEEGGEKHFSQGTQKVVDSIYNWMVMKHAGGCLTCSGLSGWMWW